MKDRRFTTGFTIIEVMLFLAITGLMLSGLMIGISGGVNRERYNDAVTSLHDYIQGQYNLVDNVNTNRTDDYRCLPGSIIQPPTGGQARGTSECSIVGRYITSQDGQVINSRPLYATADIVNIESNLPDDFSEKDLLNEMRLMIAPDGLLADAADYRLAWDTSVYTDKASPDDGQFSVVMLRLPTNNMIRTFAVQGYDVTVADVIDGAPADTPLSICINPEGLVSSPPLGVRILQIATNANGAQRIDASDGDCS